MLEKFSDLNVRVVAFNIIAVNILKLSLDIIPHNLVLYFKTLKDLSIYYVFGKYKYSGKLAKKIKTLKVLRKL